MQLLSNLSCKNCYKMFNSNSNKLLFNNFCVPCAQKFNYCSQGYYWNGLKIVPFKQTFIKNNLKAILSKENDKYKLVINKIYNFSKEEILEFLIKSCGNKFSISLLEEKLTNRLDQINNLIGERFFIKKNDAKIFLYSENFVEIESKGWDENE